MMDWDGLFARPWRGQGRIARLASLVLATMAAAYLVALVIRVVRMTLADPPIHSDFHALWSYARIAMQDGALSVYDPQHLAQAEIALGRDPLRPAPLPFAYPPPFLLLVWPLGWLSYPVGYAVWMLATLGMLLAVMPRGRWLLLLAPATAATVYFGQSGFLFAALLVGGMRASFGGARLQVLGGVLLGVAACKPQLGVLVPVALLAMRAWRTIGAACLTVAALIGLTVLMFGAAIWPTWVAALPDYASRFDAEMTAYWYLVPTVEGTMRLLGFGSGGARLTQAMVALPVLVLVWQRFRPGGDAAALGGLCIGTFLVTPHAFVYDLPLAVAGLSVWLTARRDATGGFSVAEGVVALATLLLPAFTLSLAPGLPLAVPILAVQWAVMLKAPQ